VNHDVSVSYATADGTAKAGLDYAAAAGTLTFAAGETAKAIHVSIVGDTQVEDDETFSVLLRSPSAGVDISDAQGDAVITDDDQAINAPPVAIASATPSSGAVPLSVYFSSASSYDPDGGVLTYSWTFGDGETSSDANPTHVYDAIGSLTATLTVTDAQGATSASSIVITTTAAANKPPVAAVGASTLQGIAPLTVTFLSSGSFDPDGTLAAFHWTFGNGASASGAYPTYTFTTPGTYTVRLTVTDNLGLTDSKTLTVVVIAAVNLPPVASIDATVLAGAPPLMVGFSSAGSSDPDGTIESYIWRFGDGMSLSSPNPTHLYMNAGIFVATLTVTDDKGATDTKSLTITIAPQTVNRPPVAAMSATPTSGLAPLTVAFSSAGSGDSDGSLSSYLWSFGTGETSSAANPSYTYTLPGTYTASLRVTDDKGATDTATILISVVAPASVPNQPPTAVASAAPASGAAPIIVSFSSAGSADADGAIVSYLWQFGTGATSSAPNPTYTYATPGVYTATLTVTDDKGATSVKTLLVTATAPVAASPVMWVGDMTMDIVPLLTSHVAKATITVIDGNGLPVANAIVAGRWLGMLTGGSGNALTDANGRATITSKYLFQSGSLGFNVTQVTKNGMTYDASRNVKITATAIFTKASALTP
jgi:PKD repeat protein